MTDDGFYAYEVLGHVPQHFQPVGQKDLQPFA